MNETKVSIYWELLLSIFISNCRNRIDFSTNKCILRVHFGMMDDSSYADQTTNKIEKYCCTGYYLGGNLITTFETSKHPLLSSHIEQKIQRHFR